VRQISFLPLWIFNSYVSLIQNKIFFGPIRRISNLTNLAVTSLDFHCLLSLVLYGSSENLTNRKQDLIIFSEYYILTISFAGSVLVPATFDMVFPNCNQHVCMCTYALMIHSLITIFFCGVPGRHWIGEKTGGQY